MCHWSNVSSVSVSVSNTPPPHGKDEREPRLARAVREPRGAPDAARDLNFAETS